FPPIWVGPILNRPSKRFSNFATDLQSSVIRKPEEKTTERFLQRVKVFMPAAISHAVMVLPNLLDDDFESFGRTGKHANRIFSLLILRQGALLQNFEDFVDHEGLLCCCSRDPRHSRRGSGILGKRNTARTDTQQALPRCRVLTGYYPSRHITVVGTRLS